MDQPTPAYEPWPVGTRVKVNGRETDEFDNSFPAPIGTVANVTAHVSAEESDASDGNPFYWVATDASEYVVTHGNLELVKTAEQMKDARIPTAEEIAKAIDLMRDGDNFEINETERVGPVPKGATLPEGGGFETYVRGVTDDGLAFSASVLVVDVQAEP